MSLFNENVLPGKTGRIFVTNAKEQNNLRRIARRVLTVDGVQDVGINDKVFPVEITIHADDFSIVSIKEIEKAGKKSDVHIIPKSNF